MPFRSQHDVAGLARDVLGSCTYARAARGAAAGGGGQREDGGDPARAGGVVRRAPRGDEGRGGGAAAPAAAITCLAAVAFTVAHLPLTLGDPSGHVLSALASAKQPFNICK
mgnify:CR=1 FL=1